jgi:WD40 repeat protein
VKLWDSVAAKEKGTLEGHNGKVTSLAFSGDGKLLVSGSSDRTAKLWDIPVDSKKDK